MSSLCVISREAKLDYILAGMLYGNTDENSDIIFSRNSGFYDEEFLLRIYAPTDEIYYTLDGSDPNKESIKYDHPLIIVDASKNPNMYSMQTTVTTRFSDEIDGTYLDLSKEPLYKVPEKSVDKCNVLKVVYYDYHGNKSEISEKVYFVGFQEKEGYEDVGIISITTQPGNLFDYEDGIYVTGKYYDEYKENGIPERKLKYWERWDANYHQRGSGWEKKSYIQIFDKDKKKALSQNVGIRIQGGASRGYYPKSLNIYAREEYGDNRLKYDFWETGYNPKRMTLTSGGNDYYTKVKDRLVSELASECDVVTMNYEPYALFLNGEYWGFYYLTEKYDVQFIEHYYGIKQKSLIDDVIIIKNDEVETGVSADWHVSYSEMKEFILNNDMQVQENYKKACELLDIDSFIDYFAIEGYIARCGDWPNSNYALWRSRYTSEQPYEDGKWRWMLFDVNSSALETDLVDYDFIAGMRADSDLFDSMCENEEFKQKFSLRVLELADTVFEKENVNQKIDEYVDLMNKPMENHYQRFFGESNDKFHYWVKDIREFFNQRRAYVVESIKSNFGEEYLGGTTQ